tara:strand:- start:3943 stop:4296 length:354 start_codon:yes stop_codon:yes gene_type:complete
MHRFWMIGGLAAILLCWTWSAQAAQTVPELTQDHGPVVTTAVEIPVTEVAETPEETAYLDQVVCQRLPRAASRLPSRARVCDTRRAWRTMAMDAEAEVSRLQNMSRYNNHDPLARPQ